MSTQRKVRLRGGGSGASTPHGRRTEYPRLSPIVNPDDPVEPARPHPLRWSAWADTRTIETTVDPAEWPAWTDAYFVDVDDGDQR